MGAPAVGAPLSAPARIRYGAQPAGMPDATSASMYGEQGCEIGTSPHVAPPLVSHHIASR